jgi:DNA repair protein RecO (recombination protein O)
MIQKVKGLVLRHIKYKESSAIIHVYTNLSGRQSYLVNNIRGKKSRYPGNLLQALTLLELEAYHKESRDLQRLKDIRNYIPYRSIPFDPHKNSQALFLAEILYKVLREEEANQALFEFLEHSLQVLDMSEEGTENFHLLFLVQLSRYLGFYPEGRLSEEKNAFDMRNGQFNVGSEIHPDFFSSGSTALLDRLLITGFNDLGQLNVNQNVRNSFLEDIVSYYSLHVQGFGKVKSLSVLHEIFRN